LGVAEELFPRTECDQTSHGSGSKIFQPRSCRSDQPSLIWVQIWKISPKNYNFFNFFLFGSKKSFPVGSKSTQVKNRSASYLLQVKSMLGSGQGPSLGSCLLKLNNFLLYALKTSVFAFL